MRLSSGIFMDASKYWKKLLNILWRSACFFPKVGNAFKILKLRPFYYFHYYGNSKTSEVIYRLSEYEIIVAQKLIHFFSCPMSLKGDRLSEES